MSDEGALDESLSLVPDSRSDVHESPGSVKLRQAVANLVLETTCEGVWLIDASARTTFVNERIAGLLGYSVQEMLGVEVFAFMDDEGRRLTAQNLKRRRSGVEEQHEFKCIRKDGTPIWLLITANPVYDRHGRYAGSLAMISDLTLQKAREQRLTAELSELKHLLNVRTREASEAAAKALDLEKLVVTDVLTGLSNRRHFDTVLAAELSRCRRHERRCCILMIDLDGFKDINDRFGHAAGDAVLRTVGAALGPASANGGVLRVSDVIARYGGDEFGVLAVEASLDGGSVLAERILVALRGLRVEVSKGVQRGVSASIGVASYPIHTEDRDQLMLAADAALYQAKKLGGNRARLAPLPV